MRHLLLTRFAIPIPGFKPASYPDWLPERYALLERYVLPSVEAQTCKDFEWVLIANPNFPWIDHKRLESYSDVLWVDMEWDDASGFESAIRPYTVGEDWLLTSRLDSDDAISNTFIEELQGSFVERESWYTHPFGYIVRGEQAYPRYYPSSPFVSYGEPASGARTVYRFPHTEAGKGSRLIDVSDEPAWVQVDHGGNVKNNVQRLQDRGRLGREYEDASTLTQFSCDWKGRS